eukprot:7618893-Pyramimonas_sp.AAC.1
MRRSTRHALHVLWHRQACAPGSPPRGPRTSAREVPTGPADAGARPWNRCSWLRRATASMRVNEA